MAHVSVLRGHPRLELGHFLIALFRNVWRQENLDVQGVNLRAEGERQGRRRLRGVGAGGCQVSEGGAHVRDRGGGGPKGKSVGLDVRVFDGQRQEIAVDALELCKGFGELSQELRLSRNGARPEQPSQFASFLLDSPRRGTGLIGEGLRLGVRARKDGALLGFGGGGQVQLHPAHQIDPSRFRGELRHRIAGKMQHDRHNDQQGGRAGCHPQHIGTAGLEPHEVSIACCPRSPVRIRTASTTSEMITLLSGRVPVSGSPCKTERILGTALPSTTMTISTLSIKSTASSSPRKTARRGLVGSKTFASLTFMLTTPTSTSASRSSSSLDGDMTISTRFSVLPFFRG